MEGQDYLYYDEIAEVGENHVFSGLKHGQKVVYDKGRMVINIIQCQMTMEYALEHGIILKDNR